MNSTASYKPFIYINDVQLPVPVRGLKVLRSQFVDSGRNALGQVVSQKINRRIIKFDSLEWVHLTAEEWHKILIEIEKFEGTLRFWDARTNGWLSIRVYWGDASEEPYQIDETGKVTEYLKCSCNIVDMGY